MAAPMIAAAALGFLGSQATNFVATPGAQPALRASHAAAGAAQSAPKVASVTGSICAGAAVGAFGAVAAAGYKSKARVACKAAFDPTKAVGVLEPMGYWDPCGLMKERVGMSGAQWKDEATFEKYRVAELKHGRLAMMAATGMITNTFWKFPGFEGVPDGVRALQESQGGAGFGIIFLLAAGIELLYPTGEFPDPLGLGKYDNWGYTDAMKNKEIANGRVAMSAVITFWLYEYGDKVTPSMQLTEGTNYLAIAGAVTLLGFAWGNPKGWPQEYVPTIFSSDATTATPAIETVNVKASLPESAKETEKVEEKAEVTA